MSIWSSLIASSSGLSAFGRAISVVGNNIANVSTTGFKGSRASFSSIIGGGSAGKRTGAGVIMPQGDQLFGQGGLMQTGRNLDLSVFGDGFFVVDGNYNGVDGTYYTRDGRFGFDNEGFLVNPESLKLQGYMVNQQTGELSTAISDLQFEGTGGRATEEVELSFNLDSNEPAATPGEPSHQTSFKVYDSLGQEHSVEVMFEALGGGGWEWYATVDGGEVAGGTAGTPVEIGRGNLTFNTDGQLMTETGAITVDFNGATAGQAIAVDFGDSITTDGGTGVAGSTQYAGTMDETNPPAQDGFSAGSLVDVEVNEDGTIRALYSNGQSRDVARLATASFAAESGLQDLGGQIFMSGSASGEASIGFAASGSRGKISSGALEGSNVDLSNELVTLIQYQRAFQANARAVTTADELLSETANLKR